MDAKKNDELMRLLDKAISDEKGAIDLYLKMADMSGNQMLVDLFKEFLSVQEMNHLHMLENMKETLTSGVCKLG